MKAEKAGQTGHWQAARAPAPAKRPDSGSKLVTRPRKEQPTSRNSPQSSHRAASQTKEPRRGKGDDGPVVAVRLDLDAMPRHVAVAQHDDGIQEELLDHMREYVDKKKAREVLNRQRLREEQRYKRAGIPPSVSINYLVFSS